MKFGILHCDSYSVKHNKKYDEDTMAAFEAFLSEAPHECPHKQSISVICPSCEKEMQEDFIIHNLESFADAEIADAIKEGVTSFDKVQTQLRVNQVWEE